MRRHQHHSATPRVRAIALLTSLAALSLPYAALGGSGEAGAPPRALNQVQLRGTLVSVTTGWQGARPVTQLVLWGVECPEAACAAVEVVTVESGAEATVSGAIHGRRGAHEAGGEVSLWARRTPSGWVWVPSP